MTNPIAVAGAIRGGFVVPQTPQEPDPRNMMLLAILELAREVNGSAVRRTIGMVEAEMLLGLMATVSRTVQRLMVYSQEGFVSPNYWGDAWICFFKAERDAEGEWIITAGSCNAKGRNRRTVTIYPYDGTGKE